MSLGNKMFGINTKGQRIGIIFVDIEYVDRISSGVDAMSLKTFFLMISSSAAAGMIAGLYLVVLFFHIIG
jgi:hypothetical protein